jgi:hypothetical protein
MRKSWRLLWLSGPLVLAGCDGLKKAPKTAAAPVIDPATLDKPAADPAKAPDRANDPKPTDSAPGPLQSENAPKTERPDLTETVSPPKEAPLAEPAKAPKGDALEQKSNAATEIPPTPETKGSQPENAVGQADAPKKTKKSKNATKPAESAQETEANVRDKIVDLIQIDAAKLPEWVRKNVAYRNVMKAVARGVLDLKDKANQHYVDTFPEFLASVFQSFIPILKGYKVISVKLDKSNKNSKVFLVELESNEAGTDGHLTKVQATVMTTNSLRVGNVVVLDAGVVPLVKVAFDGVCENGKIVLAKWDQEINRFKK